MIDGKDASTEILSIESDPTLAGDAVSDEEYVAAMELLEAGEDVEEEGQPDFDLDN